MQPPVQNRLVIAAARRTPIGAFQGVFNTTSATELAAAAARAALQDSGCNVTQIDAAIFGCVLTAGQGQAPARQATLAAGLPTHVATTTVNKVCGSAMQAIMLGCDQIKAGSAHIVLAGGFESMSRAPYLLPKARQGYRLGHGELLDHMFFDGLQNPYDQKMMGTFADATAEKYQFTRAQQDAFAAESVRRAQQAVGLGAFTAEIAPVQIKTRQGEQWVTQDETPALCNIDKIPNLKPAFNKDGTVTAASASSIADGAAALVLTTQHVADDLNHTPLAHVIAYSSHAQAPEWFTTAPSNAIKNVLNKTGWQAHEVDLYEINEAFACVTMAAIRDLNLDPEKVNVNGGACALGHPIGATGARIVTTLIYALQARGLKRGIAALCIGGGEATAIAIELP